MTMNVQQPSAALSGLKDRIDRVTHPPRREVAELTPPSFGEEHRGAIDSIVTGLVGNLSKRIADLHALLDQIEQSVLSSAERAKSRLEDHVAVCVRVDDEIRAMKTVVEDLAKDAGREVS
jgi:hypothetical protein